MLNKDLYLQEKDKALSEIVAAIKSDDADALGSSFQKFCSVIEQKILNEAAQCMDPTDMTVLAARGVRQLTKDERQYYEKLIDAMKSSNPKQAITEIDVAIPRTIIESVFEEMTTKHELLNEIDFINAPGIVDYIYNAADKPVAAWGDLTDHIRHELTGHLRKVTIKQRKLSAFFAISQSMIDLGPIWVDRYIRTLLSESIYFGLENAIIQGTGNNEPIGMIRDIQDGVPVVGGEYPEKELITVTDFSPASYGSLVAKLAKNPLTNIPRTVTNLILIVNQIDYYNKVMPATTKLTEIGTYVGGIFPIPTKVIQSASMPEGRAVIGIGKKYALPAGIGKDGKIEYDDSIRFLEDERVYKVKMYSDGFPKDNAAFLYLDVSNLAALG